MTKFKYDPNEKVADNEFLTPVYFKNTVLVKYLYDPRAFVSWASETYGSIYFSDSNMAFGINSDNQVFAWLGDLRNLPPVEQQHWASENIRPQGNTESEFFMAQIHAEFTDDPLALQVMNSLHKWNTGFSRKYGCQLYKPLDLDKTLEEVRRYRMALMQRKDDFVIFVNQLNQFINENVDTTSARKFLIDQGIEFSQCSKGNKLLELIYVEFLKDSENMIAPFFYLYDLRIWATHQMGDEKLNAVAESLDVSDASNYEALLSALLRRLLDSTKKLYDRYAEVVT